MEHPPLLLCQACWHARNYRERDIEWIPSQLFAGTWWLKGRGKIVCLGKYGYAASASSVGPHEKIFLSMSEAARWLVQVTWGNGL